MSRIGKDERHPDIGPDASVSGLFAKRMRVYPKAVHGIIRRIKWTILAFCLVVYYALPWIRWQRGPGEPTQAVLLDLSKERFYFFNLELWPQDIWLLAGLLIAGAIALFLVTSLFGRLWCGYACPQTVWTDLFMWVERQIEGDRNERMRRDAGPLTADVIWKKVVKHAAWLGIAFWTGGAWIMYFVDAPSVTVQFWTGAASAEVYFFTFMFTGTTYLLAGWAREQVCIYMCPWPRFQSAMLDDQSFTVAYQAWRGEPRTRGKRAAGQPTGGDCVDCGACVTACPMGIDIRDGIQLECINCGLCMDACNHVMDRLGRDKWLITWDTLSRQASKKAGKPDPIRILRPRTMIYLGVLAVVVGGIITALVMRTTLTMSVQRSRAPLFVILPDGSLRNAYTVKIANKTQHATDFALTLTGLPGARMEVAESGKAPTSTIHIKSDADEVDSYRILITATPAKLATGVQPIEFVLQDTTSGHYTETESTFMGPVGYTATKR